MDLTLFAVEERKETCILFVGEGDFSFSANYITKAKNNNQKIYATCLCDSITEIQKRNIQIIEQNGGFVYTDVDATCLESHPEIGNLQFSKIVFNFPHIPGKMNIRKNRCLVEQFFISSKKILEESGSICVTLCQGQGGTEVEKVKRKWCDTWQVVSLAATASLILYKIKLFHAEAFESYTCTGFRGLQKPFNTKGALTHIFKYGSPVHLNKNSKNYLDVDLYLQDCESLYRNICRNIYQPPFRVLSILNDITKNIYQSIHQENINDFLTCRKFPSTSSNLNFNMGVKNDFCENCIRNLFSHFVNKMNYTIACIICSFCCVKMIDLSKNPFYHLVSYFSNDSECLLASIPVLLKNLKEVYNLRCIDESAIENDYLSNMKMTQRKIHCADKSVREEFSVKCILNIYAKYALNQENGLFFYSDIHFLISDSCDEPELESSLKIGSILQFDYEFKKYTCALFNLNTLANLRYHVMDYRILLSENSFFTSQLIRGCPVEIYRSPSLYPPTYIHDTSFYVDEEFCENDFFMVVRNVVGYLIKSVILIDCYYDQNMKKHSRCYRFSYQSCYQALSKDRANVIHTEIMRRALANSLNISLR